MQGLNFKFKNAKKIAGDENKSVFMLDSGHKLEVAHAGLSKPMKAKIMAIPVHMAEAGMPGDNTDDDDSIPQPAPEPVPEPQTIPQPDMSQIPMQTADSGINYQEGPMSVEGQTDVTQPDPSQVASIANQTPAQAGTNAAVNGLPNVSIKDMYNKELEGIKQSTDAKVIQANALKALEQQRQADLQTQQTLWNIDRKSFQDRIGAFVDYYKNQKINPNQYLENMSTGGKIATAIGLLLGGAGAHSYGGVNPAAQWLNGQIERDVEAQKNNINNKKSVYQMMLDQYHDEQVAHNMATATQYGIYASKIGEAGAKAASAEAKANATLAQSAAMAKIAPLVNNAQLIGSFNSYLGKNGNTDPSAPRSETQFQTILNNAKIANPQFAQQLEQRYLPGVGIAEKPVTKEDADSFANYDRLDQIAKEAIDLGEQEPFLGKVAATLPGTSQIYGAASGTPQKANDLTQEAILSLNHLAGLNRLNEQELNIFKGQVKNPLTPGSGAIQSWKDFRENLARHRMIDTTKLGLTHFSK